MIKRSLHLIFILALLAAGVSALAAGRPGQGDYYALLPIAVKPLPDYWISSYTAGVLNYFNDGIEADSGNYLLAGATGSSGDLDAWALWVNAQGTVLWQKTFGSGGDDTFNAVALSADGNYVLAGAKYSSAYGREALVVKLDENGDVVWQKYYGSLYTEAVDIQPTTDGGYLVAGVSPGPDYWVMKLDGNGSVSWQKAYSRDLYQADYLTAVRQAADGGYIAAGYSNIPGFGRHAWVLKLDGSGNIIWQKLYRQGIESFIYDLDVTNDGGIVLTGATDFYPAGYNELWVFKLNGNGSIAWNWIYSGQNDEIGYAIQQTTDGGYLVAGQQNNSGSYHVWLLKLYGNGTLAWQKSYDVNDEASFAFESGSGIIAGGGPVAVGPPPYANAQLLKLNGQGDIAGCPFYGPINVNASSPSVVVQDTSGSVIASPAVAAAAGFGPQNVTTQSTMLCEAVASP